MSYGRTGYPKLPDVRLVSLIEIRPDIKFGIRRNRILPNTKAQKSYELWMDRISEITGYTVSEFNWNPAGYQIPYPKKQNHSKYKGMEIIWIDVMDGPDIKNSGYPVSEFIRIPARYQIPYPKKQNPPEYKGTKIIRVDVMDGPDIRNYRTSG